MCSTLAGCCLFDRGQSQSSELLCSLNPPTSLLTNSSELRGKKRREADGHSVLHYIKAEFLAYFLLKSNYQVPIIRVPQAPLHFLYPCAETDPPWMAGICCPTSSPHHHFFNENFAHYCSGMGILSTSNGLHVLDPVIEVKIQHHLPYWMYHSV